MAFNPKYYWDETKYHVHKNTRMVQGKALHIGLRTAMGGGAASVASDLAGPVREALNMSSPVGAAAATTGEILMASTGGLVSIGLGAGIDSYLNHIEHKHSQRQLTELYRPQIASLTGKEPAGVEVADLKSVASTNPSLQEELKRTDRKRTVKNIASIGGTVVAFAAVFAAITFFPPLAGMAVAAATGGSLATTIGFGVVAGGLGFVTHKLATGPLKRIGEKVFGLDKPSVEDKITQLSKQHRKDRPLTPEQVMDVYVGAQPELAAEIKANYGKPYADLGFAEKRHATAQYAERLQTPQITAAINAGDMNVRELTFRVHGQNSGVYPEDPWQDKLKDMAQEKLDPLQDKLVHMRDDAVSKFHNWRATREQNKLQDDVAKAIEEGRPLPEKAEEIGNETYWRNTIARQREAEAAKSAEGPARA